MYNSHDHRFARLTGTYGNETRHAPHSAPTKDGSAEGVSGARTENSEKPTVRKPQRKRPSPHPIPIPAYTSCTICMETIQGNVTLKCGHEMCPTCYAMHSRVNNTCPYCRDVFAPEVEKAATNQQRIPIDEAESLIDQNVREYYHDDVREELMTILKETEKLSEDQINDIQLMVYCHIYQASMNTYHAVDELLYENEE